MGDVIAFSPRGSSERGLDPVQPRLGQPGTSPTQAAAGLGRDGSVVALVPDGSGSMVQVALGFGGLGQVDGSVSSSVVWVMADGRVWMVSGHGVMSGAIGPPGWLASFVAQVWAVGGTPA